MTILEKKGLKASEPKPSYLRIVLLYLKKREYTHAENEPTYLAIGSGGHFKNKNPNVSLDELRINWVEGVKVVYIGKATSLRTRLRQYFAFGQGKKVGHWGGRFIWQLTNSRNLIVCWKTLTHEDPSIIESILISTFKDQFGKRPFANLKD